MKYVLKKLNNILLMNHKMKLVFGIIFIIAMGSCTNSSNPLSDTEKQHYLNLGDSIATTAQQSLLKNVTRAIQENGTAQAVAYCNIKATPLTDSISKAFTVKVKRLTDKTRNPENSIRLEADKKAWEAIKRISTDPSNLQKHILIQEGVSVYYYKAIQIGMPTCLSCHGNKETDIDAETLENIFKKYPSDLATGYKLGDLRGMWKIKLE